MIIIKEANNCRFKRMMSFILSIFATINLYAYDFEVDGIYYNIVSDEDYTLSVTNGDRNENIPYNFDYSGIVNIPATVPFHRHDYTVVAVEDMAFIACINVSYIVLPSTLIYIGERAFQTCQGLSSISLPEGLVSIGDYAFMDCDKLESIVLPKSLKEIGIRPFVGCNKLNLSVAEDNPTFSVNHDLLYNKSTHEIVMSLPQTNGDVVLPDDIITIRAHAFSCSRDIRSVTVNEGVTKIEDYTFAYSNIQRVNLPVSIVDIGNNSFAGCLLLYDVNIQGPVKSIGDNAFQFCSNLPLIELPSSVQSIGKCAFQECSRLKGIDLPKGLTVISSQTFQNCISLENVVFPKALTAIGSCAFMGCKLQSIEIDDNITEIGDSAFMFTWAGTSLYNVKVTVKGNSIKHMGKYAFYTEHDKLVKIYSDIPPLIEEMSFGNYWGNPYEHTSPSSMTIHVKKGLLATYKEAEGWDLYTIIDDLDGEAVATIDNPTYSISIGEVGQASVTIKPDAVVNTSVKWSVDNSDIVFIDQNTGQFIGLQVGETPIHAEITAVYAGEQIALSATALVMVRDPSFIQNIYSLGENISTVINLDGTRASHKKNGIKIVRMSDGSVKKVLVVPGKQ